MNQIDGIEKRLQYVEIESLEQLLRWLGNAGSAAQVRAVKEGIAGINKAYGMLDARNRGTALYHLALALVHDEFRAMTDIIDLAEMLVNQHDC